MARAGGRTDDPDLGPQSTHDLIRTCLPDAIKQRLGLGFLGLGQQHMESIRGSSGHAIGLAGVRTDDRPDACRQTIRARRGGKPQSDHDDARGSTVAGHPGILVAKRDVPVRAGIHGNRALARRPEAGRAGRGAGAASCLGRRPVEEGLDDLADALVVLVVRQDEALALAASRRAASRCWRRVVGQLGHGERPV